MATSIANYTSFELYCMGELSCQELELALYGHDPNGKIECVLPNS